MIDFTIQEYTNESPEILFKIDLGRGDRSITEKGIYNAEYKISIPKELAHYV